MVPIFPLGGRQLRFELSFLYWEVGFRNQCHALLKVSEVLALGSVWGPHMNQTLSFGSRNA